MMFITNTLLLFLCAHIKVSHLVSLDEILILDPKHASKKEYTVENVGKYADDNLGKEVIDQPYNNDRYRRDNNKAIAKAKADIYRRVRNEILSDMKTRRKNSGSQSSSEESLNWKKEWKLKWEHIKNMAYYMNDSRGGDTVNMVAARPWGVPCGDPNQHDMPWGTCMLAMECESEYRIYRGDHICGRTEYVCCAIIINTYDMYHGFDDVSFSQSSLETDSDELKVGKKIKKNKKDREKKRRHKIRKKRKSAIKKQIKKTVKEISKILNRTYRFGTKARQRKTKQLKKFVKEMKRKYKQDRQSIKDIQDFELLKVDKKVKKSIGQMKGLNKQFMYNTKFRKWVVNGTLSLEGQKVLREHYPELWERWKRENSRRQGAVSDYFDDQHMVYDIEYGMYY